MYSSRKVLFVESNNQVICTGFSRNGLKMEYICTGHVFIIFCTNCFSQKMVKIENQKI